MNRNYLSNIFLWVAGLLVLAGCGPKEVDPKGTPGVTPSAECIKIEGELIAASNIIFTVTCTQPNSSYKWDFGDNQSLTSDIATHQYSMSGTYVVTLTVTSTQTNNVVKTVSKEISITKPAFYVHKGFISGEACWEEGIHIIEEDVTLSGVNLCIKPGAIIKFKPGTSMWAGKGYNSGKESQIMAEGTADKPILFTSYNENPQPGDYAGLSLSQLTQNHSVFRHCIFEYGGKPKDPVFPGTAGSVMLKDASVAVFENCTFRHSVSNGLHLDHASKFALFANNHIHNVQNYAIYLNGNHVPTIGANNRFESKGLLIWPMIIEQNTRWEKQTCPYIIYGNSMILGSYQGTPEPTFEIAPGVEIRFESRSGFSIGSAPDQRTGKLIAHGTAAEPIVFTAMENSWQGIIFELASASISSMQHCVIEKVATGENDRTLGAINIHKSEVSITNCRISTTKSYSVYLDHSGNFNRFENNELGNPSAYSLWIPVEKVPTIGAGNTFSGQKRINVFGSFVNKDATWKKLNVPYYIGNGLQVGSDAGATLTLLPGVILEFDYNHKLNVGHDWTTQKGTLIANGTASNPIIFTKSTQAGKWGGVHFSLYTGANSIMNYCQVRNADYPTYVKAVPLSGVPVLSNCTFADGSYYGLTIEKSSPTQLNNTFLNNYLGTISVR